MIKINIPTLEELEKENPRLKIMTRQELVTMVWILSRQQRLQEEREEIRARIEAIKNDGVET